MQNIFHVINLMHKCLQEIFVYSIQVVGPLNAGPHKMQVFVFLTYLLTWDHCEENTSSDSH